MKEEEKKYFEKFKSDTISVENLNQGIEKANKLGSLAKDFLLLISMIKDALVGKFKLSTLEKVTIISAIVYVASPVDTVPDIIPIAGFVDDASVVAFVLSQVSNAIKRYKNERF